MIGIVRFGIFDIYSRCEIPSYRKKMLRKEAPARNSEIGMN